MLRIAVLAGAVLTGSGCLPGEEAKSGKSDAASFGFGQGNSNVNRSDKRDPLLDDIADAAQTLFDSPASTASRKSGVETAAYNNGATTSDAAQAGALGAPLVEDIPDIPANVALSRFFSALAKVEAHQPGKTVTILHLGDSHIAADRFSGDLREQFQSRFGDAGRGMLMPGLYLADGVKFDRGGEWQAALSTGKVSGPYGLSGAKLSLEGQRSLAQAYRQERAVRLVRDHAAKRPGIRHRADWPGRRCETGAHESAVFELAQHPHRS